MYDETSSSARDLRRLRRLTAVLADHPCTADRETICAELKSAQDKYEQRDLIRQAKDEYNEAKRGRDAWFESTPGPEYRGYDKATHDAGRADWNRRLAEAGEQYRSEIPPKLTDDERSTFRWAERIAAIYSTDDLQSALDEAWPLIESIQARTVSGGFLTVDDYELNLHNELKEEYLVNGAAPVGTNGIIVAAEKSGKSWLALELVAAATTGTPFLGDDRFAVERKRKCLIFYPEGRMNFRHRINMLHDAKADRPEFSLHGEYGIVPVMENFFFDDPGSLEKFGRTVREHQPDLVVIDSMWMYVGKVDTNDLYAMGRLLSSINGEIERNSYGTCALWVVLHEKKGWNEMDLQAISGVGFSAWANDWILMERTSEVGEQPLNLKLQLGGRDRLLDPTELDVSFKDGSWQVTDSGKQLIEGAPVNENEVAEKIIAYMRKHPEGSTVVDASKAGKCASDTQRTVWARLHSEGIVKALKRGKWVVDEERMSALEAENAAPVAAALPEMAMA